MTLFRNELTARLHREVDATLKFSTNKKYLESEVLMKKKLKLNFQISLGCIIICDERQMFFFVYFTFHSRIRIFSPAVQEYMEKQTFANATHCHA